MDQPILDKIRKLHALAENAGTEHEAALAASRVADLCRQHNLDIGVATLIEEEKEATEAIHEHEGHRWQAHWTYLSNACDKLFDVASYRASAGKAVKDSRGVIVGQKNVAHLRFYGLKANVQSAVVTYEYLLASTEAMLESEIGKGLFGASDYRSFRLGCAHRIFDEARKVAQASVALIPQTDDSTALIRLGSQLIHDHKKKLHLRSGGGSAGPANRSAYSAGYAAGGRVDIHGARTSRMLR